LFVESLELPENLLDLRPGAVTVAG
jgi:hypothetical protein